LKNVAVSGPFLFSVHEHEVISAAASQKASHLRAFKRVCQWRDPNVAPP
jgi:hypothetical protein